MSSSRIPLLALLIVAGCGAEPLSSLDGAAALDGAISVDASEADLAPAPDLARPRDLALPDLVLAGCDDGRRDGDETDVDCGGTRCRPCESRQICALGRDCASGLCSGGVCAPPDCADGRRNGAEVDVDCGGPCAPCRDGLACAAPVDCASGVCAGGRCAPPTCMDGARNGGERDVDCAGPCAPCPAGRICVDDADCVTGWCGGGGRCAAPDCMDGAMNGGEPDVDCGGRCAPCADGRACLAGTDCESAVCAGGRCAMPGCADGARNGDETDVDCGGSCGPCLDGGACAVGADCASLVCDANRCAAPGCMDGVKNGGEADVDCGGGACPGCAIGRACTVDADCAGVPCDVRVCGNPISCAHLHAIAPALPDGVYFVDPDGDGPAPRFRALCDMTTDGGGWTAFFAGRNGAANGFAELEDTAADCADPEARCLRRVPAYLTIVSSMLASCGAAKVKWSPSPGGLAYLARGTQGAWQVNTNVMALDGNASAATAAQLWTGQPNNKGWILTSGQSATTFASSYRTNASWDRCNGAPDAASPVRLYYRDACAADVTADPAHCGTCGAACSASHVARACAAGSCAAGVCEAGFDDCNGDKRADGCEADLSTSVAHCGACAASCSANHVGAACVAGSCEAGACDAGFADCNGDKRADGCEVDLGRDVRHCGACGAACGGGQGCVAGACVAICGLDPATPGASCLAIRDACAGSPDGVYWLDPDGAGGAPAFQALCDMTTDGGGWTAFFVGHNGSPNVFAHFEDVAVSCADPQSRCLRRLPAALPPSTWFLATCGAAALKFNAHAASLAYWKTGVQGGSWRDNVNVTAIAGGANVASAGSLWTGQPGNKGWILAKAGGGAPVFSSSYNVNNSWDACNGVGSTGSAIRLMYR